MTSGQVNWPDVLRCAVALVDGSAPADEGFLAPDVKAWLASPEQGLSADIESISGAAETAEALARLAPSSVTIMATAPSERICWAEISRRSGGRAETCIVGLSRDEQGQVSRIVLLRAPLVPAIALDRDASIPDARPVIELYFADLMHSRFKEAAGRFSLDTIYSHPPYRAGAERALFLGRDALSRGFADERGATPARQVITGFWQRRDRLFVEGVVEGIPAGGTFAAPERAQPVERGNRGRRRRRLRIPCALHTRRGSQPLNRLQVRAPPPQRRRRATVLSKAAQMRTDPARPSV